MTAHLHHTAFRAMGTACRISATAGDDERAQTQRAVAAGRDEVARCERVLSRFAAASDLSRLNAAAGEWVAVDPRLEEALRAALRLRTATDGRFDPTILPALVAAGYDRSFELLDERPPQLVPTPNAGAAVDVQPGRARVERGAAVDLGGIGKGLSAARALRAMTDAWPSLPGAIVDLGGDLALFGLPPEGGPWRIAIADPHRSGETLQTLLLERGSVATSGRNTRRFGPAQSLHHLIDPLTGAPAAAGPLAVTVVAEDGADAEGYATALAISSLRKAEQLLARRPDLGALFVDVDGGAHRLGALPVAPPVRALRVLTGARS